MIEVQLFIPTADNAGATFDPSIDGQFEAHLIRLFGGMSQLPGTVAGAWADAGTVYRDAIRVYAVFVAGLLADGVKLMDAVTTAKALYGQLAITVRYLGLSEIL